MTKEMRGSILKEWIDFSAVKQEKGMNMFRLWQGLCANDEGEATTNALSAVRTLRFLDNTTEEAIGTNMPVIMEYIRSGHIPRQVMQTVQENLKLSLSNEQDAIDRFWSLAIETSKAKPVTLTGRKRTASPPPW